MRTPFKFLDAYTQADKEIFFGRDAEIEELYARALQGRLVLVYGPSGVGKTSLIQCGLANKFAAADWLPVTVRHGGNIFAALERALAALAQTKMPPAAPLNEKLHSLYLDYFKPVTLIFDQFEELFIFGTAPERERLAAEIGALLEASFKLRIILVIREEYLAELTALEPFLPDLFINRVRVERMSRANAIHAIAGPCHACNVGLEADLAEQILARLGASKTGAIELTYLQVLLDKLYARSLSQFPSLRQAQDIASEGLGVGSELRLTIRDLDALGDLGDILGAFLNEQLAALKEDAALGEAVLKTLITPDGTKKAMSAAEIIAGLSSFGSQGNTGQIPVLLNHFVSVRILSEKEEASRYELRHDSLAQKIFERMTALEKDLLEVVQTLENRYKEYAKRGTLLDHTALEYVAPYESRLRFNPQLIDFISLSRQTLARTRRKRLIVLFASLIAVLVVVSGLGIFSYLKYRDAEKERQKAEQQTEIAQKHLQETQALMTGMQLTATSFMSQDKLNEAITVFQNLLKLKPDHAEAWYEMGNALAQQGKLDEALIAYRKQVEVKPDHPDVWFGIGYALAQQGKLDEAVAAYRKQVKINPDNKGAWNNMGNVLAKQGKQDEAIAAFRKQVEVKPDNAEAWNGMGNVLAQQGKLDEALTAYRKQVEVKPDHADAWNNMGSVFWEQGKLDEAAKAHANALKVSPDNLNVLSNDIELALIQGDIPRFQARFTATLPLVKSDSELFAILPFYAWLAKPAQGWEPVLTAIEQLAPGVEFTWGFATSAPILERQDAATRQAAQHFIAFFEGKIDLPTLQARLEKFRPQQ